ncbi:unnamed protein product [Rhizoctonia solani]|uniref:Uncharacterized protein n=1 Tax=Rhizoctonia solani TaxID=456999 RepID=A0A8H3GT59_9AGAM|nr:unnamed protein product [Rhizoctonia solani]
MANSSADLPPVQRPTRSRFASEDRIGEAQFYPAGSPLPMDRRGTETPSERAYYQPTGHYVEEPQSYAGYEHYEQPPPAPVAVVTAKPKKKQNKIKQMFSRLKRKKKVKPERNVVVLDSPERPLPATPHTESDLQPPPPVLHPVAASDISSRRYELRDPGFVPHRMTVTSSRDESLRAKETTRASTREGSVFGPPTTAPVVPPAENSLFGPPPTRPTTAGTQSIVSPFEQRWTDHSGQVYDAGPPPMLVDEQSGNKVPRDVSYASSGSPVPPKKKKRSLGGLFKRLFTRKKKRVPAEHTVTIVESEPVDHEPHYAETHYTEEVVYEQPVTTAAPTRTSRSSAASSAHRPAVVVRPGSRTNSARTSAVTPPRVTIPVRAPSSRASSAAPPVVSPRSSHSHPSAQEPMPEVVIPVSPRDSLSLRRGPSTSAPPPRRYNTGSSVAGPSRYNTAPSMPGLARHGTDTSAKLGRYPTTSTTGGRTVPITTAPVVSRVTASTDSPSPSIRTRDQSWDEVHVPQPVRAPPPVSSRPGGLGLGLGSRPLASAIPTTSRPAARAPRRTYAAPPPRKPYVHVPRPIPPPPRYPSLPTRILPATSGSDAQVQMIVTALRDLAAEERHRTAVTEQRLAEERAWNEEERQRDAELRALIAQLVARNGSRATVDEFGVREGVRTEVLTPTAAARGLGVGGSDVERLLDIMRQGHEVTMQTFRDMIDRWRRDIDDNHERFLAEQAARREARERKREKPIRWQPGVNIWEPNY